MNSWHGIPYVEVSYAPFTKSYVGDAGHGLRPRPKITASLELLFSKRYTVLDVGVMYGFEHEQSYIRAFKKYLGLTPGEFLRRPVDVPLTERFELSTITAVQNGLLFRPVIRYKKVLLLASKLYPMNLKEN